MRFDVEGILRVQTKDGKRYGRIDYMGGSVSVLIGQNFQIPVGDEVFKLTGSVRFGKTGAYFIVENAE